MPSWFNVIYSTFLHIELYSWELSFWFHGCVAFSWHVFIHSFIQVFWNKEIGGGGCGWRRNLEIETKFSEQNFCNRDSQASFDQVMVAFFSLSLPQLLRLLSWCQGVINVRHPQASSHFRRIWGHRLGVGERQLSEITPAFCKGFPLDDQHLHVKKLHKALEKIVQYGSREQCRELTQGQQLCLFLPDGSEKLISTEHSQSTEKSSAAVVETN